MIIIFNLLSKNAFENCCFEMIAAISGVILFFLAQQLSVILDSFRTSLDTAQ